MPPFSLEVAHDQFRLVDSFSREVFAIGAVHAHLQQAFFFGSRSQFTCFAFPLYTSLSCHSPAPVFPCCGFQARFRPPTPYFESQFRLVYFFKPSFHSPSQDASSTYLALPSHFAHQSSKHVLAESMKE